MKLRLSATEYMMIDIPQEVNKQEFYGLIKRMNKYQKFFTDGDVFSLKEEKEVTKEGTKEAPSNKSSKVFTRTQIYPILIDKEKSKKELRTYYTTTIQGRHDRAKELGITFKDYGIKMNYLKKKWKFTPKEIGVSSLNLGHHTR